MRRFLLLVGCAALNSCQSAPPPVKGSVANGQAVFRASCAVCHNTDSRDRKVGPGLKGLFQWNATSGGVKPTAANIRAKVENGGNGMPGFKDQLSATELDDLMAYLRTL